MINESRRSITISYRDEGRGMGAFWDNHTIQLVSGAKTRICYEKDQDISDLEKFHQNISNNPDSLPSFIQTSGKLPPASNDFGQDLLVIPGNTRKTEQKRAEAFKKRSDFENKLLQDAINRGRPVLAICGGSWRLWQALGGKSFIDTPGHDYPHFHPKDDLRISQKGEVIGNKMAHHVQICSSLLAKAMQFSNELVEISVNSIHWQAADSQQIPENVMISAKSVVVVVSWLWAIWYQFLSLLGLAQKKVLPEADVVEAFETKHGAPMIGVQWHPEAYANGGQNAKAQRQLFHYMAEAGKTYGQKQETLKALKSSHFFQKKPAAKENVVVNKVEQNDVSIPIL